MKLWQVRCSRCGVLTGRLPVTVADVFAGRHKYKCKGSVVVEKAS